MTKKLLLVLGRFYPCSNLLFWFLSLFLVVCFTFLSGFFWHVFTFVFNCFFGCYCLFVCSGTSRGGGGAGEWALPYFWTKLMPERPLGDRPSPTPLISRYGSDTGMGVLSRFLGCFGPSLLGFELLFTKFWPFSISRKMKGEKIAICWPKSWANPFRKFHFLELYTDQYFYSFRTAVFCLEHYQTLSHGLKKAKNEL